jgi:type II secretory pathway pseudopilin PulG
MKRRKQGTIGLPVLLVTATIGMVSLVAVPTYQLISERATVTEALTLAGDLQRKLAQNHLLTGSFPTSNKHASAMISSRLSKPDSIRDIRIQPDRTGQSVIITVMLRDGVVKSSTGQAQYIQITGRKTDSDQSSIAWQCVAAGIRPAVIPDNCRG